MTTTLCGTGLVCTSSPEFDLSYTIGDGTVPFTSATRIGNGVNLNAPGAALHVFTATSKADNDKVEHTGLTQNPAVWQLITYIRSEPVPAVVPTMAQN